MIKAPTANRRRPSPAEMEALGARLDGIWSRITVILDRKEFAPEPPPPPPPVVAPPALVQRCRAAWDRFRVLRGRHDDLIIRLEATATLLRMASERHVASPPLVA